MGVNLEEIEQRLKAVEDHIFERGLACREFDPVAFAIADRYGLSRLRAMMVRYMLTNKIATYGDLAEITRSSVRNGMLDFAVGLMADWASSASVMVDGDTVIGEGA